MAEVVEEFVAETLAFMGAGDEASNIEELDRDGAPARDAGTVVRLAAVGEIEASAGTGNLEVADCALRVDGCETRMRDVQDGGRKYWKRRRREVAYGKFPAHKSAPLLHGRGNRGRGRGLTDFGTCIGQAVVKVRFRAILGDYRLYLLRVVDLPDDGLPTSPMRGSRGIARSSRVIPSQKIWDCETNASVGLEKVVRAKSSGH